MFTAVYDRLDLTLDEVKEWLKVETSDDDQLIEDLLDSVKREADSFLQNPFEDEDGNPEDIPEDIKLGVLMKIARYYEKRVDGLASLNVSGLGSRDWEGLSEVKNLWLRYRKFPWEHIEE